MAEKILDRVSVEAAIADYLLQVNYREYQPDSRKVLAVRSTDRTAWLRNAEIPVRREVYYFIEGELFPDKGRTRLPEGVSHTEYARVLVDSIWDELWVWNGYDFTTTSYGLNQNNYLRDGTVPEGSAYGGSYASV